VRHLGTQPEDQVYWNQYRFLPRPALYLKLDRRWIDIAGFSAFDDQNGYDLSAPNALPAGCQAGGDRWFGVANVPREWETHQAMSQALEKVLSEILDGDEVDEPMDLL
jgi:hypothetical protein